MPFGDELTDEQKRQLSLEQIYKGFLSGRLGQEGQMGQMGQPQQPPPPQMGQSLQPDMSTAPPTGMLQTPQQAPSPIQPAAAKPQPKMSDIAGLLAGTEDNQKKKWVLPVALGLLNMSANMGGRYYPGLQAPPWQRGMQGMGQGIIQGMQLQKADQDEVYKKIKAYAELKKAYAEPEIKQFTGPDGKIVNAIVSPGGRTTLIGDNKDKTEKSHWTTIQGPNGPIVKMLKPGEEAEAYIKEPKQTQIDQLVEEKVAGGMPREQAVREAYAATHKPDKEDKDTKISISKAALTEKLGRTPTASELEEHLNTTNELDLTPGAIDAMSERYMIDGTMPGLGLGKAATKARSMVMNKVAEKLAATGQTPQDIKTNQIVSGGLRSEANRLLGQRGPMLAFAETADKNLDVALKLSGKVDRTGTPVVNRWLLAGRKSLAGDPDVAAFHAATQVAINEFAKVTSSATGGGVTSDTARKEIEELLNTAQTPEQFKAVADTLRLDMKNRVSGYESSLIRLQEASKKIGIAGDKKSKFSPEELKVYRDKYNKSVEEMRRLPDGPEKEAWAQKLGDPKLKAQYGIE